MRAVKQSLAVLALLGLGLGLGACGDSTEQPAKPDAAALAAAKEARIRAQAEEPREIRFSPGRWESEVKIAKLDLGNVPPQVKQVIERQLGTTRNFAYCLTPEEAEKPDSKFFNRGGSDDCAYDQYTMAGGHIDVKMSCKTPQGTQKVTLNGTYSADNYSMTMSTSGDASMGVPMLMTMSLSSRRAGDCHGDEGR